MKTLVDYVTVCHYGGAAVFYEAVRGVNCLRILHFCFQKVAVYKTTLVMALVLTLDDHLNAT